mmetsp:Transcript_28110/g.43931  ORF Transcript_28110/g.43931 Transcript_28110/m.43931 type:complete len:185 (+) Transcript_28110:78-632(+)
MKDDYRILHLRACTIALLLSAGQCMRVKPDSAKHRDSSVVPTSSKVETAELTRIEHLAAAFRRVMFPDAETAFSKTNTHEREGSMLELFSPWHAFLQLSYQPSPYKPREDTFKSIMTNYKLICMILAGMCLFSCLICLVAHKICSSRKKRRKAEEEEESDLWTESWFTHSDSQRKRAETSFVVS